MTRSSIRCTYACTCACNLPALILGAIRTRDADGSADVHGRYKGVIFRGGILPHIHAKLVGPDPEAYAGADADPARVLVGGLGDRNVYTADDDSVAADVVYAHVFSDYGEVPESTSAEQAHRGFGAVLAGSPQEYAEDVPPRGRSEKPEDMGPQNVALNFSSCLTDPQIRSMAARAGLVALVCATYEELREITKRYLEGLIRDAMAISSHRMHASHVVDLADIAGVSSAPLVFGSGRLGIAMKRSLMRAADAPDYSAEWEDAAVAERAAGDDDLTAYFQQEEAEGQEGVEGGPFPFVPGDDGADDSDDEEHEWGPAGGVEGGPVNFVQHFRSTLRFVRAMQKAVTPLIPYRGFSRMVANIASAHGHDVSFTAAAVRVLNALVEDYITVLLEDANLVMLHASVRAVEPKDLQLARRIRGERC